MPRTGRPTNDPKNFRLELRFTEAEKEMLEICAEVYCLSKAEICRRGLKLMYDSVDFERRLRAERDDWEVVLTAGDRIRITQIRSETYASSYKEAYDEKYSELILDTKFKTRQEVVAEAAVYAEKTANATVDRAVNVFLGLDENILESMKER